MKHIRANLFKKTLLSFAAIVCLFVCRAQQDAEGSKDHPMLSRMPNFYIYDYASNFNSHVFPDKPGNELEGKSLEGNLVRIDYRFNAESGKSFPSCLQVIRNYSNAVTKLGGTKVTEMATQGEGMFYCGVIKKEGKEIWVHVGNFINDNAGAGDPGLGYSLYVMEIDQMQQEVSATDIFDALNSKGFIALNINFDSGKSIVKPESMSVIDELVKTLTSNADLKVSIEGHTDNVGDAAANKKLSAERAKAVLDLLVSKGVATSRLSSTGWGQEKAIADNRTDEGKAKNRRVEIIKK